MTTRVIFDSLAKKNEQNHKSDYEWYVELPILSIFPVGVTQPPIDITSLVSPTEISHRVYSIDTPYDSFDTNKNTDKGSFWYSAMHSDIGNVSIRVDEMEDGQTLRYITNWQSLIRNSDGTHNVPAVYKKDITIYQLNKAEEEIIKSVYRGYFPTEVTPTSWSYDGSSVLQYAVTFTGDSVTHEKLPASARSLIK